MHFSPDVDFVWCTVKNEFLDDRFERHGRTTSVGSNGRIITILVSGIGKALTLGIDTTDQEVFCEALEPLSIFAMLNEGGMFHNTDGCDNPRLMQAGTRSRQKSVLASPVTHLYEQDYNGLCLNTLSAAA